MCVCVFMWTTLSTLVVYVDYTDQLSGLVVRVSALRLGGRGSIPGRVIPDLKNGTRIEKWEPVPPC